MVMSEVLRGKLSGNSSIKGYVVELMKGDSAYQVAVGNGFAGTEIEWLESLVGPRGEQGPKGDKGEQGPIGPAGSYTLPMASSSVLGGVKIGSGLKITASGVVKLQNDVARINEFNPGSGYILYTNGLKICWGQKTPALDGSPAQINFPIPFETVPAMAVSRAPFGCDNITTTGFEIHYGIMGQPISGNDVFWIAVGK